MRERPRGPRVAVFLGAGFGVPAGLPMASQLFDAHVTPLSGASADRLAQVRHTYREWQEQHPRSHAEEFIQHIYDAAGDAVMWWGLPVSWGNLRELICLALAEPLREEKTWVGVRTSTTIGDALASPVYSAFWAMLLCTRLRCVVTTNYDLLIERSFGGVSLGQYQRAALYYGGFYGQQMIGVVGEWDQRTSRLRLQRGALPNRGRIPLFKLHGSLNWEECREEVKIFTDMRSAFKRGGRSLIIPPLPEKNIPRRLVHLWRRAGKALAECPVWILCGYSMPTYDVHVSRLIATALNAQPHPTVIIVDPRGADVRSRLMASSPHVSVHVTGALPVGLGVLPALLRDLCGCR